RLQQHLVEVDTRLRGALEHLPGAPVADDAAWVVVKGAEVSIVSERELLYYPVSAPFPEAPYSAFDEGERLEQRGSHSEAAAWYRTKATSRDPAVRAGASVREARNLTQFGEIDAALRALAGASTAQDASIGGVPADLFARYAECELLASLGKTDEL